MLSKSIAIQRRGIGSRIAFVVCGPSGAGKNSVIERVMQILPGLAFSVSYTTRARRVSEIAGKDYHYISRLEFDQLTARKELIEHVTYLGDQYGTSLPQVMEVFRQGKDVILNIDVNGAKLLRNRESTDFSAVYVFLTTSSLDILKERVQERGTENETQISARLELSAQEMKALPLFDYLVLNDTFSAAVDELQSIIIAERARIRIA